MTLTYAIVFVSDMKRSVAFYRDLLGLPLKFETPQWTEFATGSATLALHQSAPSANAAGSHQELAGTCRPGLTVPDIDVFHKKVTDQNVRCAQPPTETFGVRIAQYLDPDGLLVSVSENQR